MTAYLSGHFPDQTLHLALNRKIKILSQRPFQQQVPDCPSDEIDFSFVLPR